MIGPEGRVELRANRHPKTAAMRTPAETRPTMRGARQERRTDRTGAGREGGRRREPLDSLYPCCSWAMTALACAASGEFGSTSTTFCRYFNAPALSPLLSATSPSLKSGLPQFGSVSDAFWYHFAASSVSPLANFTSPSE